MHNVDCKDCNERFDTVMKELPSTCYACGSSNIEWANGIPPTTRRRQPATLRDATPSQQEQSQPTNRAAQSLVQRHLTESTPDREAGKATTTVTRVRPTTKVRRLENTSTPEPLVDETEATVEAAGEATKAATGAVAGTAKQAIVHMLKQSETTKGPTEWYERNKPVVDWVAEFGRNLGQAIENHSKRMYELKKQELERSKKPKTPEAPPLPPFSLLPLNERMAWMQRGGIRAYEQQAGVGRNGSHPHAVAASTPAIVHTQTYTPPPATPPSGGEGFRTLAEARAAIPPLSHQEPPTETATPAPPPTAAQPPTPPPTPAPTPAPTPPPPPAPETPDVEEPLEGEEVLPDHLRSLPYAEKKAILMANQIIKQEHATTIANFIGGLDPAILERYANDNIILVRQLLGDIEEALPLGFKSLVANRNLGEVPVQNLLMLLPEPVKATYVNLEPDGLLAFLDTRFPERPDLQNEKVRAWLTKNLRSFKQAIANQMKPLPPADDEDADNETEDDETEGDDE